MNKTSKKINFKEKLTDDYLDLSLCGLETIPVKEIVVFALFLKFFKILKLISFL